MTLNEIKSANIDTLKARQAEIKSIVLANAPGTDFVALETEMDTIDSAMKQFDAQQRLKTFSAVESFGKPVVNGTPNDVETKSYDASSPEYRTAWLKSMGTMSGNGSTYQMFGPMTDVEQKAFTFTTGNTPNVVPTVILNRIIELVESRAPMYEDSTKMGMEQGFSIPRHVSIDAGDAAVTEEGVANDDEQDTFNLLTLDGVEIKKHIDITRKMKFKSIQAFEDWIVRHIADRIAVAKETHIRTRLSNTTYGIAAENVKTGIAYSYENILMLWGLLRGMGAKRIYANETTIWTFLAKIVDGQGKQVFIPDASNDPIAGRILGAEIRVDNAITDHHMYGGYSEHILSNDYDELTLATDTNIKTWVETVSGYSLFDAGLEHPKAMFKAVFDPDAVVEQVETANILDLESMIAQAVAQALAAQQNNAEQPAG